MSKNVLIIGGGTGMGEAIALSFAKEGWKIAIAGRRQEKLDDVAKQATEFTDQPILSHTVDVGERSQVEDLFEWFLFDLHLFMFLYIRHLLMYTWLFENPMLSVVS